MAAPLTGGLLLPHGQVLYSSAVATQRHLHELLKRLRAADVCGYLAVLTPVCDGVVLFLHGMPLYAIATRPESVTPRYDRDAFDLLRQTVEETPTCSMTLQRLEERQTRALAALFQPPTFTRKLANPTELRFVLEVVGGCCFHGCLQFRAGSEHAVVLVHQGRPLGVYDVHGQHVQKGLAGPMSSVLGQPNPQIGFYPQPIKDPVTLAPPTTSPNTVSPGPSVTHNTATPAIPAPASAASTTARVGERAVAAPRNEPALGVHTTEAKASPPMQVSGVHGARTGQRARQGDPVRDEFAESQLLWLLTSLDRRWGLVKEKRIDQPSTLTALAAMLTQTMAKVEAARTGDTDSTADPKALADVAEVLRARFGPPAGFIVSGGKADVSQRIAQYRGRNSPIATEDWLLTSITALVAGIRIGIEQLIDQAGAEPIRERMREAANVYLADMDNEIASCQPAVARGRA